MKRIWIIIVVIIAAILLFSVAIFNNLVTLNETVKARWAQVENQLQRRNDLIPNLVNSVKGYAAHEKGVFQSVTDARSQWANAKSISDKVASAGQLDLALSRLIAVAENYPQLKADGTFIRLMDELAGTENRIAVERMRYNESVKDYNIAIRRFPSNLYAKIFGFTAASEYFKAQPQSMEVPEIKF